MSKQNKPLVAKADKLNLTAKELMSTDPKKGLVLVQKALLLSEEINYENGIAQSFLNRAWCHIQLAQNQQAIDLLNQGHAIFNHLTDKDGQIQIHNALGVAYNAINQNDTALSHFSKCIDLCNETGIKEPLAKILGNIGLIYVDLGKNEEALDYSQKSLKIKIPPGKDRDRHLCLSFFNIGRIFFNLNKHDQAITSLRQGMNMAKKTDNKIIESACLTFMGRALHSINQFKKSEENLDLGLMLSRKIDDKFGELQALIGLGELLHKKECFHESLDMYGQGLELSKKIDSKLYEYEIIFATSTLYEDMGDFENALLSQKQYFRKKNQFKNKETEARLANMTAQYDAKASKNEAELHRLHTIELKESYDRMTAISQIGQKITSSLEMEKIIRMIYDHIIYTMEGNILGIALYDDQTQEIDYKFFIENSKQMNLPKLSIQSETGFGAWCIKNKKEILINNIEKDASKYIDKLFPLKSNNKTGKMSQSLIYIPLEIEERINGLLTVQSYLPDVYSEKDMEMLKALGSYVAIALENSTIHAKVNELNLIIQNEKKELEAANKQITYMANHDKLTGLPNRRLFSELVKTHIHKAKRKKKKLALLFLDLDDFKPINDEHGHDFGDKVLKVASDRLMSTLRASDTCARIGGDEFVAIVSDFKNRDDIIFVVEKIISAISQHMEISGTRCQLGVSIGVSIYPDDAITIEDLLKKADTAMYNVKKKTKNRYYFFKA